MSESILDKIGSPNPTPSAREVLGDEVYSVTEGHLVGREILSTDLRGLWAGYGNGVVVESDDTVTKFDNAVLIFEIQSNGEYAVNTSYSTETNGQITAGAPFSGRLYYVSEGMYAFVNGNPEDAAYGDTLQLASFATNRSSGIGYLMDWTVLGNANGQTFLEMNYVFKLSNDPNSQSQAELKAIVDQWL
jgi:hypothetical protein